MPGIYIHIPYCKQACNYCDFHFSTSLNNRDKMMVALLKEIALRKDYLSDKHIKSIYFGGGTPSLLSEKELNAIICEIKKHFIIDAKAEITLEANPDDITKKNLAQWLKAGINRLSIGLQSFNNEELKWMNRAHTAAESVNSVKMAQDMGFDNISIDLIYGSKFQTLPTWQNTLLKAVNLQTKHISSYNLTIENKTLLGIKYSKGNEPAINDELSSNQFILMQDILAQHKFIQYEISNFGKKNFFAVHNTNYWMGQSYLGIGPSAHSYNGTSRQWNIKNNSLYIQGIESGHPEFEKEELSLNERYNEYVLTRLRTIWGCDTNEMERLFGTEILAYFKLLLEKKQEFIDFKKGIYTLNNKGKLQADGIASSLFII